MAFFSQRPYLIILRRVYYSFKTLSSIDFVKMSYKKIHLFDKSYIPHRLENLRNFFCRFPEHSDFMALSFHVVVQKLLIMQVQSNPKYLIKNSSRILLCNVRVVTVMLGTSNK